MNKIKLAFICSNLPQGGAEKQLVNLITQIDKNKFEVTVLLYAVQVPPFYLDSLQKCNIKLELHVLKHKFFIFKIFEAFIKINFFLKENKYDLVISSLFMNNFFVRLMAPSSYKNKIITKMRTSILNYPFFYKISEIFLVRKSYIVFNSQKSMEEFKLLIQKKFHWRFSLIYNGYFTNLKSINLVEKTFGFLGRIDIKKNVIQVAKVFQDTLEIENNSRFIIQGDFGNQYNDVVNLIWSKNIKIQEKNKDVDIFFNSINILILPSFFEGCPNVLFEALLRRKLCIISKGANSDDFITNGVNGFVYDGSDENLKKIMIQILTTLTKEEEKLIKENGYNYAKNNFSMKLMVSKYEELFKEVYERNKMCNQS